MILKLSYIGAILLCFQFGVEYLELCTEVGSIALKNDTKLLDSCRAKHDDMTNNNEELSKTCREIADLYSKHNSMCTVSCVA